jgi:hypothetical protein
MLKRAGWLLLVLCLPLVCQVSYIDGARTIENGVNICSTETGTGNTYACAMPTGATIRSYNRGVDYVFVAAHPNSAAATINIDGRGAKTIKKKAGTADLASGDIALGSIVVVRYDGTNMQLVSSVANDPVATGSSSVTLSGDVTGTGTGTVPTTLATVNASTGTFGSASQIPVFTVDAKGRITGVSTVTSAGGGGGLTALSPSPAGSYGSSTTVPVLTVNQYGQVTAASTVTVSGGGGSGGTTTALTSGATSALPATCTTGGVYFATDQPALQQLYTCSATNTWTQMINVGGSGALTITGGSLDIAPNVLPRLAVTNSFTGLNSFAGGVQLPTTGTQPTCSSSNRGLMWVSQGTNDTLQVCLNVSGTPTWVSK